MSEGDGPRGELVRTKLDLARTALDDATGAADAGLSDAVVVNRLYYACFHAEQAVLYDRGQKPEGDADSEDGELVDLLSNLRQQADYGSGAVEEDLDDLQSRSREFVAEMESLCSVD